MYGGFGTPVWFMCTEYMVQPSFGCSGCSFLVVLVFSHLPPAALDLSGQIQLSAGWVPVPLGVLSGEKLRSSVTFLLAGESKSDRPVILSPRNETMEVDPGKQAPGRMWRDHYSKLKVKIAWPSQNTQQKPVTRYTCGGTVAQIVYSNGFKMF